MILVAIGCIYVVLMMAVAEATSNQGTLMGAVFTLLLYGALFRKIVEIPGFGAASYIDFLTPGIVVMAPRSSWHHATGRVRKVHDDRGMVRRP